MTGNFDKGNEVSPCSSPQLQRHTDNLRHKVFPVKLQSSSKEKWLHLPFTTRVVLDDNKIIRLPFTITSTLGWCKRGVCFGKNASKYIIDFFNEAKFAVLVVAD